MSNPNTRARGPDGLELNTYLDAWGDSFFNQAPIAPTKATRGLRGLLRPAFSRPGSLSKAPSGAATRAKLDSIARRKPEVLVKISGGGKGIRQIKDHLDYITRNGKLELEDQDGQRVLGRQAVGDLRDEWRHGAVPIPEDGTKREAFNIVLSMPAGTDPLGVKRAARDFASREFAGHQYGLVLHTYETDPDPTPSKNPHVHLCVKARADDGIRLNPRKADLQRWREEFAKALGEHGIEATATKRAQRLQRDRPDSQAVYHRKARGAVPRTATDPQPPAATRARTTVSQPGAAAARMQSTRNHILGRYREALDALAQSEQVEDRKLAVDLVRTLADKAGVDLTGRTAGTHKAADRPQEHPPEQGPDKTKPGGRESDAPDPNPVR